MASRSRLSYCHCLGRRPSPEPTRAQADGGEPVAVTLLKATPVMHQGGREELVALPLLLVASAVVVEAW